MELLERRICVSAIFMVTILYVLLTLTRQIRGLPVLNTEDLFFVAYIPISLLGSLLINHFLKCENASEFLTNLIAVPNSCSINCLEKNSDGKDSYSQNHKFPCPGNDTELQMKNSIEYKKDSVVLTYNLCISKLKQKNVGFLSPLVTLPKQEGNCKTSGRDGSLQSCENVFEQQGDTPSNSFSKSLYDIASPRASMQFGARESELPSPHNFPSQDWKLPQNFQFVKPSSTESSQKQTNLFYGGVDTTLSEENVKCLSGMESLQRSPDLSTTAGLEQALANEGKPSFLWSGRKAVSDSSYELNCPKLASNIYPLISFSAPEKTRKGKKIFDAFSDQQITSIKTFHFSSKKKGKKRPHENNDRSPIMDIIKSPVPLDVTSETRQREMDLLNAAESISREIIHDLELSSLADKQTSNLQLEGLGENSTGENAATGAIPMPENIDHVLNPELDSQPGYNYESPPLLAEYRKQSPFKSAFSEKSFSKSISPESEVVERATLLKWKTGMLCRRSLETDTTDSDMRHTGAIPKDKLVFGVDRNESSSESSTEGMTERPVTDAPESTKDAQKDTPDHQRGRLRERESPCSARWRRRRPSSPRSIPDPERRVLEFSSDEEADPSIASNAASRKAGERDCGSPRAAASPEANKG